MRKTFADLLRAEMAAHPEIVVLTADLGYGMWNRIAADYPARFHNVGAAEQALVGVGVGLALAGKVPVCYSITPFLLWRPAELIRLYLEHESIPVKLVGCGRDRDYLHDGFTHWAEDAHQLLACFPSIVSYWPSSPEALADIMPEWLYGKDPGFLNLPRTICNA